MESLLALWIAIEPRGDGKVGLAGDSLAGREYRAAYTN